MLEGRITTPAFSAWVYPVVMASKKDGTPLFRADYSASYYHMKPDRFPLLILYKIIKKLAGGIYFTRLKYIFSGHQQAYLEETVKINQCLYV